MTVLLHEVRTQPMSVMARLETRLHRLRTARRWLTVLALIVVSVLVVSVATGRLGPDLLAGDPRGVLAPPSARPSLPGLALDAAASSADSPTRKEIAKFYAQVQEDPQNLLAYIQLGYAYLQNVREEGDPGDYGRADAALKEALRLSPGNPNALLGQAQLALARHRFASALDISRQIITTNPGFRAAYGAMGDAQTELGMYPEAVESIQRLVDMRPDLPSYSRVSYQRELHGDITGAKAVMRQAFSAGSASGENLEYVRVLIGNLYFLEGDLATADKIYQASLAASDGFVWAIAGQARVRAARGDFDAAIALYQRAIARIPLPEFVIALGETQEVAGNKPEAEQSYALVRLIQDLFRSNGVNTDLDLALFEANHGSDAGAAVGLARKAYEVQPNIKGADALGWALYKDGQLDEARRYAEESLRLGTHDGTYLFHAGMIAKAQNDLNVARDYLSRAFEWNPYFSPLYGPEARAALTELGGNVPVPSFAVEGSPSPKP